MELGDPHKTSSDIVLEDEKSAPCKITIGELSDLFSRFDRDKDGSITELEMGSLLRSLGLNPDGPTLEALVGRADTNNNGLIEFSEFVSLITPKTKCRSNYTDEQLERMFQVFDQDGNGYISASELACSMENMGYVLSAKELSDMIAEADTDGDGLISFSEFKDAMRWSLQDFTQS